MDRIELTEQLSLSRLAYGMWRLADDTNTAPSHVQAKIEACLAQGLTTMDQADIYGDYSAEALLGACLKEAPHLRDKIEIVTKCGIVAPAGRYSSARVKHYDTSAAHIRASVEHSLRLMQISQIDLLLIHRPDPFMDHIETGQTLDNLVKSGQIRSVGVSNFKPHDLSLLQSAMETSLLVNQIEMSLLETASFTNGDLAFLQEHALVPMAWSPLGGGAMFSKENPELRALLEQIAAAQNVDVTAVAIAWLLAHPAEILPVMGTNRLDRIARFSDAFKVEMTRETWFELYTKARGAEVP